jgi:hypothetical protein
MDASLWLQLFVLSPSEDIPLWHNKDINRKCKQHMRSSRQQWSQQQVQQ